MNYLHIGDCRSAMRQWISDGVRVQTCVTSPPYWGLRDYGVDGQLGREPVADCLGWATGSPCGACHMVEVFRLVGALLADDGTCWINYGDSYASSGGPSVQSGAEFAGRKRGQQQICTAARTKEFPAKNLIGMPWRVAFALQADGWILRQDIIWAKPNPMPESVTDRCTKAHEYLFLLSKSPRYYFDADSIKEPVVSDYDNRPGFGHGFEPDRVRGRAKGNAKTFRGGMYTDGQSVDNSAQTTRNSTGNAPNDSGLRNKRSVWTVPTFSFSDAHFATFPPRLIEPCILAGSRPGDVVFDPFMGSGTTAAVALDLGRQYLGCELNPAYGLLFDQRVRQMGLAI